MPKTRGPTYFKSCRNPPELVVCRALTPQSFSPESTEDSWTTGYRHLKLFGSLRTSRRDIRDTVQRN